jgi:hypothetical protein
VAARIGDWGSPPARPVEEQGTNQVRSGPDAVGAGTARTVAPVDQCVGSCERSSWDQGKSKSKDKKSKSKSDKKSKSKA